LIKLKQVDMKKILLIIPLFIASAAWGNNSSGSAYSSKFDLHSNGGGSAASTSYKNTASIGQSAIGSSWSSNYKNSAGFLTAFTIVIDVVINFLDESPSSSEYQDTTDVTCKVTVETSAGNNLSSVKYRLSNSGSDETSFLAWQSDASVDSTPSATKVRYKIAIPNAGAQTFTDSENNFIQWRAKNTGGIEAFSAKYRVKISTNDAPEITIIQPDEKGGFASASPQIEAEIKDKYWGVDPDTIEIKLDNGNDVNVSLTKVSEAPTLFSLSKDLLSFKYNKTPLTPEATYKLTISASDKSGKASSQTVTFVVKAGAIADLVPYPSPFDPKKQPIKIRYVLNKEAEVSVNVYDMSGRLVKTVTDNQLKSAGINEDEWAGANYAGEGLANGVYFCEITAKDADGEHRRYSTLAIFGK